MRGRSEMAWAGLSMVRVNGRWVPGTYDGYTEHTCGTCTCWQAPPDEPEYCLRYPYSDDLTADSEACPRWTWEGER